MVFKRILDQLSFYIFYIRTALFGDKTPKAATYVAAPRALLAVYSKDGAGLLQG